MSQIETRAGVTYATHDGVALAGDLYLPAGAGLIPRSSGCTAADGSWARATPSNSGAHISPSAATRCSRSPIAWQKKGQKMFPQAVNDVLAAVQFVRGTRARSGRSRAHRLARRVRGRTSFRGPRARRRPRTLQGRLPQDAHAGVSSKVKALIGVYGVYDLSTCGRPYALQTPAENNIANFLGATPMDDPQLYFDASPINYATFANNHIGVLLSVGTEDDLVDRRAHTDGFQLRLSQAGFLRTALHRAPARRITG